jgi:hypothetical protein
MSLWLTIPVGERRNYLEDIIKESNIPPERIVIVNTFDNTPTPYVHNIYDHGEINIHRWWNKGIHFARHRGAKYVAVLNDDLVLSNDPLNAITKVMEDTGATLGYPVPHNGNICGYCFVLNLDHGILPNESYRWWYGDNDLWDQAKRLGGTVGALANVNHLHGNELTSNNIKLMALANEDKKLYFCNNVIK